MTGTQQNTISCVCSMDKRKVKYFLADEKLLQVCSTDKGELKSGIVDNFFMEEIESTIGRHCTISYGKLRGGGEW